MTIISSLFNFIGNLIGNTPMGTTATTLTGAIAEVKTDVDAVTTDVEPTYGVPGSYTSKVTTTSGETHTIKSGGICVCQIRFTVNSDCSADQPLYTMPNNWHPTYSMRYTFHAWDGNATPYRFTLYSKTSAQYPGVLCCSDAIPSGKQFLITFTYAL